MKRVAILVILCLLGAPALFAQEQGLNHGEVGAYFDYFRLNNANNLNLYGLGGRVSLNARPHVVLEAEGSYDFEQSFDTLTVNLNGTTNTVRSDVRVTHGLFGPKFQLTRSFPIRPFVTLKGGFVKFGSNAGPATFGNAQLTTFNNTDLNGAFYPGGGIEFFAGPLGMRFDVGDEMYFDNGANHNLKITVGPTIRF